MEMFWFEVRVPEAPLYGLSERAPRDAIRDFSEGLAPELVASMA